jgi:hypothetical protein
VSPREVAPHAGEKYEGANKVYSTVARDWETLCQNMPGPMRRCYIELADNPFPPGQLRRHHRLKGKLRQFWEYEVSGGDRVRYRRGPNGEVVVVYAGSAPADTH